MNCNNCNSELNQKDDFCKKCGAKVIKERITIKSLFSNLLVALGWDSNFFVTLRFLLYKPQIVLKEYISGTRKKYANPFTFFAISLAISLFIFNQYSEQFIQLSTNASFQQTDIIENTASSDIKSKEIFGYENQEELGKAMTKYMLKYYNLYAFLLLPLYTLIAFLVFRKPYNYGEHLVINTYLQSTSIFLGIILFSFSLLTGVNVFGAGITIITFLYYSYVYKRLYELTLGQLLLKILKFTGILLLLFTIPIIIGFIYAANK
ncbi:MAG: DUF3667 domain-containing protein [Flavobacteriaceae bacterium]|nr:DUF3667 domain-containing protein [Flavobacteriaceae bacterium]